MVYSNTEGTLPHKEEGMRGQKHRQIFVSGPREPLRIVHPPLLRRLLFIFLLSGLILSCLKPVDFSIEDLDGKPAADDPVLSSLGPINITGITPVANKIAPLVFVSLDYIGAISWSPNIPVSGLYANCFEPFQDYTAVIELAMKGGHSLPPAGTSVTVDGALSAAYNAAAGTITATFPRAHLSVDTVQELNDVILSNPPLGDTNGENIILITGLFYDNTNTANNPVTIGASTTANNIPYTIKGLGTELSKKSLNVGILLANNNITLEDVKIEITASSKGVPYSGSSAYKAALSIGRYSDANTLLTDGNQNVNVKNCNISFRANGSMIAGILVVNGTSPTGRISITDNIVSVMATNGSTKAAQALLIRRYGSALSIKRNMLRSENAPMANATTNPASALFIQLFPEDINVSMPSPDITDNTMFGAPTYDFFVNRMTGNDRVGEQLMIDDKFATAASVWATSDSADKNSFYKKLLEALVLQTESIQGYGYFAEYLGNAGDFIYEAYECHNQKIVAIDYWGYEIETSPSASYKNNPDVRARLFLDNGLVSSNPGQFHWTPDIEGDNTNDGENKPNS
jgi:hypothetical protein